MQVELPESKPVETFYASLVYDLRGGNIVQGKFVQTAGQFQYHRFYLRDAADLVRMYDATGYPDIGGQVLGFFLDRQQPDGNFLSQADQYDGWGEAMWAFGEHYRMTRDREFAAGVFPAMVRGVDWLSQARAKDPLHLIPATNVRDNEYIPGHLTGYNFLALDGLDAAIEVAQMLDRKPEVERFQKERKDYASVFFSLLDKGVGKPGRRVAPKSGRRRLERDRLGQFVVDNARAAAGPMGLFEHSPHSRRHKLITRKVSVPTLNPITASFCTTI